MNKNVRVRFAPSPTGPLHMGGVRTALFNYLFAKKNNGTFILRIEDTDQTRYVPGAEDYIVESLYWCGIKPDEGISVGGEYGPYRQSDRKMMYREYAMKLIENGNAYYAFDTPEELEKKREDLKSKGVANFQYDQHTRMSMKNSLVLTASETEKLINDGSYVIRFKMPENETIKINDTIRGEVVINTSTLDDKVLFKSDGMPTYHLANVVDDRLMKISHVIRGEEWLPSTPLHVLLYRSFGWQDSMPQFAHLPLILKPTGKGKLSKRDGDQLGFPVFPLKWTDPENGEISSGYRESGYFPEAFINMLALLGWNPGHDKEIFDIQELINEFSIDRVHKAGARFDPEKAKWFNHNYLTKKTDSELANLLKPLLVEKGIICPNEFLTKVCGLVKERATFIADLWEQSFFFFQAPQNYEPKTVKKRWKGDVPKQMEQLSLKLRELSNYSAHEIETCVKNYCEESQAGLGVVMNALRLALVGDAIGPSLFDIAEMIGKEETLKRIETAIEKIEVQ